MRFMGGKGGPAPVGEVDNGQPWGRGRGRFMDNRRPSPLFCCEPKTVLENEVYFFLNFFFFKNPQQRKPSPHICPTPAHRTGTAFVWFLVPMRLWEASNTVKPPCPFAPTPPGAQRVGTDKSYFLLHPQDQELLLAPGNLTGIGRVMANLEFPSWLSG